MSEAFDGAVGPLARVPGVRGVLLVEPEAGVPIVEELAEGVSGRALAALTASFFQRTAQGSRDAGFGDAHVAELQAAEGQVIAVEAGEVVVVVLADRSAQLGRVRLEARQAAERLMT
ncbi:MAG: roadblock/LC7 domain-containing protein [Gemmatimonadota bacterium]